MAIKICEDSMTAERDGCVIATATRTGERWTVGTWPHTLTRNQAITALTLAERLAAGYDDMFAAAWREELRRG